MTNPSGFPLRTRLLPALLAALTAGCALTEPVVRPEQALPAQWAEPARAAEPATPLHDTWWQDFGSARLDAFVTEALATTPDLRIQAERVVQAELALRQAGASLLPSLDVSGGSSTRNVDSNESSSTGIDLGASYEIDLWGRIAAGVGAALAAKLDGSPRRTVVLMGDGELQEGSNWEALMAGAQFGLDRLYAVCDRNRLQMGTPTEQTIALEPLADRARAFGWHVVEIDGHDHGQILDAFAAAPAPGKPTFVISHSHKGYPISFMSDKVSWHHHVPTPDEIDAILNELTPDDIDAILSELEEQK